ncbi:MAG TPA: hypothetical protein VNO84_07490 [Burkholderiaceae bacterium]|nr:hypothetical protein [Burkholderiaceae bacterium]
MNTPFAIALLAVCVTMAGCSRTADDDEAARGAFPGQVSAGGGTSGEVLARRGASGPDAPGPSGTPGIPQGAGGNTSGAAMGGTTSGTQLGGSGGQSHPGQTASGTDAPPPAGDGNVVSTPRSTPPQSATAPAPAPAPAASAAAPPAPADTQQSQAEREKQQLVAAMDRVAARWRERAASEGWQAHPPVPVAGVAGITASQKQSSASGQPGGRLGPAAAAAPVRSEKHGTAPPSEDVKDPSMQRSPRPVPQ